MVDSQSERVYNLEQANTHISHDASEALETSLSRRSFLGSAALVGSAALFAGIAGCTNETAKSTDGTASIIWDHEADVVIAGTGASGVTTAITAAENGSSVIIIEKAPEEYMGGNSRVSMQAFWTPIDVDGAVEYIKEISGEDHLFGMDDEYLRQFCSYSNSLPEWFNEHTSGVTLIDPYSTAEYKAAPHSGSSALSWSDEGQGFMRIWNALHEAALDYDNITWIFKTPLTDFIFNDKGEVIGIEAEQDGKTIKIKARQGVALCTGGYENNDELKSNYLRAPSSLAWQFCGTPYNTGDGQIICLKHDIKMWHMNMATSGCFFGIKLPWVKEGEFKDCSLSCEIAGDYGYVWLDKKGKRFMSELRGGEHGFARQDWFFFDGPTLDWPRLPIWFFFDGDALKNGEIGRYSSYDQWLSMIGNYTFTKDFSFEVDEGVCIKDDTLEGIAAKMSVDPAVLTAEIVKYNGYCEEGIDPQFGRVSGTSTEAKMTGVQSSAMMRPLNPPYYAMQVYPLMVNTQGGPQHDKNRQLMHNDGSLIPRLYGGGECGSIWGWCYQGGANMGECMVSGRIIGEQLAALDHWDA
jgi:succinate dehydrogenase/fumarate reductase flavoprotein subunit